MTQVPTVHEYSHVSKNRKPAGKILITAGPTIEPLDPIRYISNHSTGTMGYEIAAEGRKRGFDICLVSGPVALNPPAGVEVVNATTAREMRDRVRERISEYDCVIMAAAVCDFRPKGQKKRKIKKRERLSLELVRNPDILLEISKKKNLVKVGFALETESPMRNGKNKLRQKNLDMIIVNIKDRTGDPFGPGGKKRYIVIKRDGTVRRIEGITKKSMAGVIMREVKNLLR